MLLLCQSQGTTAFLGSLQDGRDVSLALRAGATNSDGADQKHVLVTGGNKGIGKATCQKLLEEHPDVTVLMGSRDVQRGQDAVADLQSTLGDEICKDRLHVISIDTGSDESVEAAVQQVQQHTDCLYGIINNAGIMLRGNVQESNKVNYFGPRRVNAAFVDMLLQRPGGRIVNIASASGPIYISSCSDAEVYQKLSQPWTIAGGLKELDELARDTSKCGGGDAYGFSKALVSAYTWILAKEQPDLVVNAVTPGYIATDMTEGMGASNPPSMGAVPPVWLLMSDELTNLPTGRYYGSDCKRSPLNVYRGPGDPVYEGPDGPEYS